ncbi:shikimate dehydrogenase (NADP+) [bacterium]|nr:shikimate dehydrogenase (NADP+) [bacterium]
MTITGRTRVYGLLGAPVMHSLSPRLCNDAFARLGVDAVYVAFGGDPDRPGDLISGLDALGVAGVNVTYPLKAAVLPHLVDRSPTVEAIGAANVLVRGHDGGFRGENTDAPGVALAVETWLAGSLEGSAVVILGAGGAGRAAAHGALSAGAARVTFLVRDVARAVGSLAGLKALAPGRPVTAVPLVGDVAADALAAADLVVQATPLGLDDADARPLVEPAQAPRAHGFELNYGQGPTAFVHAWREAGRACLDGRDLLAAQALLAVRVWCGDAPPLVAMRRVLDEPTGVR